VLENTPTRILDDVERREPGSDFATGFNLVLCAFALGDVPRMRAAFARMLALRIDSQADDERWVPCSSSS